MGQYTNKGLYNTYDKNHKERDKLDYYATKPGETRNILDTLGINFTEDTILEPCCGGGHMAKDIFEYIKDNNQNANVICTDIHNHIQTYVYTPLTGEEYDFLSDDYPINKADWIIMNPPYSTIEPFVLRALEIANKGIIMLARLQFLEGKNRYENILKDNSPTDMYVYIDRIQCWKQGIEPSGSSAQAYAWFIWDKTKTQETKVHWLWRK